MLLSFDNADHEKYEDYIILDLNDMMSNVSNQVYDYDSVQELMSLEPELENLIDDVNEDGIMLNTSEHSADIPDEEPDDSNQQVRSAAKRATNRAMKK